MSLAIQRTKFYKLNVLLPFLLHQKNFCAFLGMLFCLIISFSTAFAATSIPFTVNMSEAVNVTGTPRIAVDVGGVTRYATYTSGTGSSALTFTYAMVAGDVDLDGVTLNSPIDLNGGTMKDLRGNDLSPLTYTVPNTSNVKVNYPSLGMDFIYDADGRYTLNGTVYNDLTSFLSAAGGSFARSSTATYYDSSGVLRTAASGAPRFDYDPVTHTAKGILIEDSRTNLSLNSADFNSWGKINTTVTSDTSVAPDNTTTADTWTRNSTANSYLSGGTSKSSSALTYTFSIYAKKNVGNYVALRTQGVYPARADIVANLNTGVISTTATAASGFTSASGSIQNVGNGWYRITLTATSDTANVLSFYVSFNSGGGVLDAVDTVSNSSGYVWGAQVEQASFSTSYIPTTSATVTRSTDTLTIPTGTWFNSSTSATYIETSWQSSSGATYPKFWTIYDGTSNNRWNLQLDTSASALLFDGFQGAVAQGGLSKSVSTLSGSTKAASAQSTNNTAFTFDGAAPTVDTTWNVPPATSLNFNVSASSPSMNKWISKFKYYPARVSNTQLQLLTQ